MRHFALLVLLAFGAASHPAAAALDVGWDHHPADVVENAHSGTAAPLLKLASGVARSGRAIVVEDAAQQASDLHQESGVSWAWTTSGSTDWVHNAGCNPRLTLASEGTVPRSWGNPVPTNKGGGVKWHNPANPKGDTVRIDPGNPGSPFPSQRIDHVAVTDNGVLLDRQGRPVPGGYKSDPVGTHIPLWEWLTWSSWNRP